MKLQFFPVLITALLISACTSQGDNDDAKGVLYIIGGGSRPASMLNEIADISGIRDSGYMYVLPMSSEEPDSAIIWTRESFEVTGITNLFGYNFHKDNDIPANKIDSIRNASLIYIPGGVQSRFMEAIEGTPVSEAIHEAFRNGAVIAGTSAGAAVMSRKMITGTQMNPKQQNEGFTTIEADNIEIAEGLGLITELIIDQHFIKRQRLNRLVSAAIENPDQICVGIDESTAIIVKGNTATVTGMGQVVVITNPRKDKTVANGLLGSKGLDLSVYVPGDQFSVR